MKPTADFCPCWPAPPDHRRPSKGRESAQGPVCPPPSPLGLFLTFFFLPSLPPALSHSVLHIFFLICSLAHFIPPSLHPSLFETQRGRLSRGAVTAGSRPAAKTAAGGCDCLARDNTRRPHACAATARGGLRGALRLRRRDCPPPVASLASDCDAAFSASRPFSETFDARVSLCRPASPSRSLRRRWQWPCADGREAAPRTAAAVHRVAGRARRGWLNKCRANPWASAACRGLCVPLWYLTQAGREGLQGAACCLQHSTVQPGSHREHALQETITVKNV